MEELFELFKHTIITRPFYTGVVCGYKEDAFILAVESKDTKEFFRVTTKDTVILEEYQDHKYRYVYADESEIWKQLKKDGKGIEYGVKGFTGISGKR